jgi:hypothetical protein
MKETVTDDAATGSAERGRTYPGVPDRGAGAPGRHHQTKRRTVRRTPPQSHTAARGGVAATLWRVAATGLGVVLMGTGAALVLAPDEPPAPTSGVVLGFRFSGDYAHRCRLWIRPDGASGDTRVLVEPNSDEECLQLRTFDRWWRR